MRRKSGSKGDRRTPVWKWLRGTCGTLQGIWLSLSFLFIFFAVPEALCLCWARACTLSNVLIGHQKLDMLWETFCLHRNIVLLGLFKHGGDLLSVLIEHSSTPKLYFQHYSAKQQFYFWRFYWLIPPKIYMHMVILHACGRVYCRNMHILLKVFD